MPFADFDQFAVEGVRHVGVRQVAFEQREHHLWARQALNLLGPGPAGVTTAAFAPALSNLVHLLLPGLQGGFDRVVVLHGDPGDGVEWG